MTQQNKSNYNVNKDNKDNKDAVKSSRELENDIGDTRNAISGDIKALNDKFSTANVKEQAKDMLGGVKDAALEQAVEIKDVVVDKAVEVKDAVVDKAVEMKDVAADKIVEAKDAVVETMQDVGDQAQRVGSATWRFTKANAVPLALLGVGAGLLISNTRRSSRDDERYYGADDEDVWEDAEFAADGTTPRTPVRRRVLTNGGARSLASARANRNASMTKQTTAGKSSRARGLTNGAGDGLERAEHAIAETASRSADYVQDKASRSADYVQDKASRSVVYVQDKLRSAGTSTRDFAAENPLLVAFATLAAGVGIGMLLPGTERENRLLRPSREKFSHLIGDVREAATDVAQVAKDTASDSLNAMT
jgi:ElaB/YqjD/DUF883 family membrane-anchored ribosome-binding protein